MQSKQPEKTLTDSTVEAEFDSPAVIDGELIEDTREEVQNSKLKVQSSKSEAQNSKERHHQNVRSPLSALHYLILPLIFLTVTLLGGLRLSQQASVFIFLKPALICLILSAIMLILFFRAGLLRLEGWFSENFPMLKNIANAIVLFTVFTASVQMFNSLLPEQGLPFWIIGLLFFWTLWNNLFSVFTAKRLVQSLGSMFGLAFVLKYLVLANLTAPANDGWLRAIIENPGKEFLTYLLALPRYAAGTGYIQFFTASLYLLGLFLLPASSDKKREESVVKTKN